MEVSLTVSVEIDFRYEKHPLKATVMGEDLEFVFQIKTRSAGTPGESRTFMVEGGSYPSTVSYTFDLEKTNTESLKTPNDAPYLPNKWYRYTTKLQYGEKPTLKIKLDTRAGGFGNRETTRRLYNHETGDVELRCGGLVLKAHKVIVSAHSETLRVAFNNSSCAEGQSGIYTIAEEHLDPAILEDLVKWMYLHTIADAAKKVTKLLDAAEYFQMAGLKELCRLILMDQVAVDNCLKMLDLACKYNVKNLKGKCNEIFMANREEVLRKAGGKLAATISHVPPLVLELLSIQLEDDAL